LLLAAIAMAFLGPALAQGAPITINPSAIGDSKDQSFSASSMDFSYTGNLIQSGSSFTETGSGNVSSFRAGDLGTVVTGTGLNQNYTLTLLFTGSGNMDGSTQNFSDFNLKLFNGATLLGQSNGFVSGQGHFFPTSQSHGDFNVLVQFQPVGGFLSGAFTADIAGNYSTVNNNAIGGSGNVAFTNPITSGGGGSTGLSAIPEPNTILLVGSGLTAVPLWRRYRRRS
jgi:hypothetical protein